MIDFPFPYFDRTDAWDNETWQRIVLAVLWIDLIIFSYLCVLVVVNIWCILIRQGKWRDTMLSVFYGFAFASIYTR